MKRLLFIATITMVGCTNLSVTPKSVTRANPEMSTKRIPELLARLDHDPDPMHGDYTPSVHHLIDIGEPALEPTLPYLLSNDKFTRMHANTTIYGIMLSMHGFVSGKGWSTPNGKADFNRFTDKLYDLEGLRGKSVEEASFETRMAYIERVKQWLASRRAKAIGTTGS